MKRSRYSEEQIVGILKEAEAGISVAELCRKYGISDQTYYNWKAKYGGMVASDVKRLIDWNCPDTGNLSNCLAPVFVMNIQKDR